MSTCVLFLEQSCSETWNFKSPKQYLFRCDSVLTIPRKLFSFLKALPTILGCLVFLFSIILPFYCLGPLYIHGSPSIYYYSFKADYHSMIERHFRVDSFWFFDYWFGENGFSPGIPWIPVAMFTFQALALALDIASIHFRRRIMLAAPVCLSLAVLALMIYTGEKLLYGDYQLGYYLVFPSLALFLSTFILNEATKKQQTRDSIPSE